MVQSLACAFSISLRLANVGNAVSVPLDSLVVRLDVVTELGRSHRVLVSVEDERVLRQLAELGQSVVHLLRGACLSAVTRLSPAHPRRSGHSRRGRACLCDVSF